MIGGIKGDTRSLYESDNRSRKPAPSELVWVQFAPSPNNNNGVLGYCGIVPNEENTP